MTLGQYIRKEREPYMTLRAFAKELDVSASYLSDIELDRRNASKKTIEKIAAHLGRICGGNPYQRYDYMLEMAELMTPERRCLKVLWQGMKVVHRDPVLQERALYAQTALYGELDAVMFGVTAVQSEDND